MNALYQLNGVVAFQQYERNYGRLVTGLVTWWSYFCLDEIRTLKSRIFRDFLVQPKRTLQNFCAIFSQKLNYKVDIGRFK